MTWIPDSYEGVLTEALAACCAARPSGAQATVTVFMPLKGPSFRPGESLLVVGRAVNGWTDAALDLSARNCPDRIGGLLEAAKADTLQASPLRWLGQERARDGYQPRRSQFWAVARNLAERSPANAAPWYESIAWSNLYKVAPHQGGNPGSVLSRVQLPACIELLRREIDLLQPGRILFQTGFEWALPLIEDGAEELERSGGPYVEASGTWSGVPFVVSCHPQGKTIADVVTAIEDSWGS